MLHQKRFLQGLKLAAVLAVALSMGACANKNPLGGDAMANAATPGSQQDFVVNVGDRVFFESDQTDLSPQATTTLDKQARWLQSYKRYSFTIEGHADERGTREYNIALGARRAQLRVAAACEFALLGLIAGLTAALGAAGAGWWLGRAVFHIEHFMPPLVPLALAAIAAALVVMALGLVGTRKVSRTPPMRLLREG